MKKYTGYEIHKDILSKYNKAKFMSMDDKSRSDLINKIFEIYRGVGIYPVTQFSDEGINEEILKCLNKNIPKNVDISSLRFKVFVIKYIKVVFSVKINIY